MKPLLTLVLTGLAAAAALTPSSANAQSIVVETPTVTVHRRHDYHRSYYEEREREREYRHHRYHRYYRHHHHDEDHY